MRHYEIVLPVHPDQSWKRIWYDRARYRYNNGGEGKDIQQVRLKDWGHAAS